MNGRRWDADDETAILDYLRGGMTLAEVAERVDRTPSAVRNHMRRRPNFDAAVHNLLKANGAYAPIGAPRGPRRPWTEREKQVVLEAIRREGQIVTAVKACGYSLSSFYTLRRYDHTFDEAVRAASNEAVGRPSPEPDITSQPTVCYLCHKPLKARGLCAMHYFRWRRTGVTGPAESTYGRKTCTTPGCGKPHRAKGYCIGCYDRAFRRTAT